MKDRILDKVLCEWLTQVLYQNKILVKPNILQGSFRQSSNQIL